MKTRLPIFWNIVVLMGQAISMCQSILQRSGDNIGQEDKKGLKITFFECVS